MMTRDELIEAGKRVANEVGPMATRNDFKRLTGIDYGHINRLFPGGWTEFRSIVGLGDHPDKPRKIPTNDQLFELLHSIVTSLGHFPTRYEIDRSGIVSSSAIQRRLGKLSEGALHRYREWLTTRHPESPLLILVSKSRRYREAFRIVKLNAASTHDATGGNAFALSSNSGVASFVATDTPLMAAMSLYVGYTTGGNVPLRLLNSAK